MASPEERGLIWITEAMVKYRHSRNWFNTRIKSGALTVAPQVGTSKVYLHDAEIATYLERHPEEDERRPKSNPGAAA